MPVHFKIIISILVLLIAGIVFYLDTQAGAGFERWLVLLLGPLMVASIWVFPEAKQKDLKSVRKDSAQKRQG